MAPAAVGTLGVLVFFAWVIGRTRRTHVAGDGLRWGTAFGLEESTDEIRVQHDRGESQHDREEKSREHEGCRGVT